MRRSFSYGESRSAAALPCLLVLLLSTGCSSGAPCGALREDLRSLEVELEQAQEEGADPAILAAISADLAEARNVYADGCQPATSS